MRDSRPRRGQTASKPTKGECRQESSDPGDEERKLQEELEVIKAAEAELL